MCWSREYSAMSAVIFWRAITNEDGKELGIHERFVQDNHSYSKQNVVRGLHYQIPHPQGKLVRAIVGEILDVDS